MAQEAIDFLQLHIQISIKVNLLCIGCLCRKALEVFFELRNDLWLALEYLKR
jgi:hypothetical protein